MLRCIISDTNIIQQAKKLLIFLFAIQLIKVPYQIYMSYLQGIGYEKLVFYCNKCWSAYMRYIMEIIRDICDNVFGILDTNMDI